MGGHARTIMRLSSSFFAISALLAVATATVITQASVKSRQETGDWRGLPVYEIGYTQDAGANGTIHRQDEELWQLNGILKKLDKTAPVLSSTSQDDVNNYLNAVVANPTLAGSEKFHEFLSLNVTGEKISNICWQFKYMVGGIADFIPCLHPHHRGNNVRHRGDTTRVLGVHKIYSYGTQGHFCCVWPEPQLLQCDGDTRSNIHEGQ